MKNRNRRLLHVEALETRTLLSPLHGLGAPLLAGAGLSDVSPAAWHQPASGFAVPSTDQVGNDAAGQVIANLAGPDSSGPSADPKDNSSDANVDAGSVQKRSDNSSQWLSQDGSGNDQTGSDNGMNSTPRWHDQQETSGDLSENSPQGENHNSNGDNLISDGSGSDHANSGQSQGTNHQTGDQQDESVNAVSNPASQSDSENQNSTEGGSLSQDNFGQSDHSKNEDAPGKTPDPAKSQSDSADPQANLGGNHKGLSDSDHSTAQSGSDRDGGTSTNSGGGNSSGTSGQLDGQVSNAGEDAVSDSAGHLKANVAQKESSPGNAESTEAATSAIESSAGNVVANRGKPRVEVAEASPAAEATSVKPAGSIAANLTQGVLLETALLAATPSMGQGTDISLPDASRLAAVAEQVVQSGLEVLATPLGIAGMNGLNPLAVEGYDLLLGFLPVGEGSLDQAMQGFLQRVEELGEQLTAAETATWLYPSIVAALIAIHLAYRQRRKSPKQQIWTAERGSWMGSWFPSLSTLQK